MGGVLKNSKNEDVSQKIDSQTQKSPAAQSLRGFS